MASEGQSEEVRLNTLENPAFRPEPKQRLPAVKSIPWSAPERRVIQMTKPGQEWDKSRLRTGVAKPESTDGRREGRTNWDEGAYKGESLGSIGTDVTGQRVFSSRTGPRERSIEAGNRVIVGSDAAGMHSRTGRTRVWMRWVGCG